MQAHFGSYNRAYGSLAGVIIFLIWMWIYNTAVLIGAEFSAERERGRAVACGLPSDEEPFTELRDTASCLGSEAGRGARPRRHAGNRGQVPGPFGDKRTGRDRPLATAAPGPGCEGQVVRHNVRDLARRAQRWPLGVSEPISRDMRTACQKNLGA